MDVLNPPAEKLRSRFTDQGAAKTPSTMSGYTIAAWHSTHYDCTSGSIAQALPSSPRTGDEVELYLDATSGSNILTATSGGTIATLSVAGHGITLRYNGTTWKEGPDRKSLSSQDGRYSAQSTMRPNVKWPAYGAAGNGTTDDTAAFTAALAHSNNIYAPEGVYLLAGLVIGTGQHIWGDGIGGDVFSDTDGSLPFHGTVLKLKNSANQDMIQTTGFTNLDNGTTTPTAYNTSHRFGLHNLVLDGNKANNSSGNCLSIYGYSYEIDHVYAQNAAGKGIYSKSSGGGYDMEAKWSNFHITDCGGTGLDFQGPHDSLFVNGIVARNTGAGIVEGSLIGTSLFTNVHSWGNGTYNWDMQCQAVSHVNCISDGVGVGYAGIRLNHAQVTWRGGSIYGSGAQGEILVQVGNGDGSAKTIQGCVFQTQWFNIGLGSMPLLYADDNVMLVRHNEFVGGMTSTTNSRFVAYTGRAQVSGAQAGNVGTLNVVSTTTLPSSGQVYVGSSTMGGITTITYTGKTSTTLTGCSGGNGSFTIPDGTWALGVTQPTGVNLNNWSRETWMLKSLDEGNVGVLQSGNDAPNGTAFISQTTQFTGPVRLRNIQTVAQTLASNGAVVFDATTGCVGRCTLQANATSSTLINGGTNQIFTITFVQDGAGGRTYVWPTNCKFAGGSAPSDTTAAKRSSV
jgi:hypothetical protein